MQKAQFNSIEMEIDEKQQKFPYCLVWTALPGLTCCLPCIGHIGICKADGTIYDFIGRGPIHSDELAFGSALKYLRMDNTGITDEEWDRAIDQTNREFSCTDHNLCSNNCHHHVARALNLMKYQGKENWGQVDLTIMITFKANHLGLKAFCIYALPLLAVIIFVLTKIL